jgi:microcystin-dependent protein
MAADPFVGEITFFSGNFAPVGWAFCDGSLLSIAEYDTLFALIGTTYGGDGQNNFALPDLRGRVPIHQGTSLGSTYTIGQTGGTETVTLTPAQIPLHNHIPNVNAGAGNADTPNGNVWAKASSGTPYAAAPSAVNMNTATISAIGGSQPHNNMVPFVAVNYIISLFGVFPSPN